MNRQFLRTMFTISLSIIYTWNCRFGTRLDKKNSIDCARYPTTTHRLLCYVSAYVHISFRFETTNSKTDGIMSGQVDNRGSLENVSTKWLAEINEHCPGVKIVLCALKCDLREEHEKDDDETPVLIAYQEGLEVAKRIGALRYLGMCFKQHPSFPEGHLSVENQS